MIKSLYISDYALLKNVSIDFTDGFTVVSGETGAGKSILLGGLSLVLGRRADLSQINNTSKKCVIEATFDIARYDLKSLFKQEDLDFEVETIIRREILPSGKSRAFIKADSLFSCLYAVPTITLSSSLNNGMLIAPGI